MQERSETGLKTLKKKKKKSQREPNGLVLAFPALGRLRQDDRTFVPVGLIPSKYHKK